MSASRGSPSRRSEAASDALPALPSTLDPSVENVEYVAPAEELDDNFFLALTAPTTVVTARGASTADPSSTTGGRHHTQPLGTSHGAQGGRGPRKQVRFAEDVLLGQLDSRSGSVSAVAEEEEAAADGHHAQQSQVLQHHKDEEDEEEEGDDGGVDAAREPVPLSRAPRTPTTGMDELEADAFAAFPQPTPPASFPFFARHVRGEVTRVQYHSLRFGEFIKAYVGLSDKETDQAKRRGRTICMIGVTKSTRMRNMTVRTGRAFLRHSVLAVEGDAVFAELIDRAEQLYVVERERVRQSMPEAWRAEAEAMTGIPLEEPGSPTSPARAAAAAAGAPYAGGPPFLSHASARRCVKVTDPLLRPNARCIALHYGFSPPPDASTPSSTGTPPSPPSQPRHEQYPRATLIAVICTTRLAENTEIYVSLESYYRCLDEAAWYQRCYGARTRQTASSSPQASSSPPQASRAAPLDADNPLDGDIYTGVKHFRRWPKDLSYFHGIGKQHASQSAEASFPFTLVDLTGTPELGEKELGVQAAEFIPYATCFLYTGPSVATLKVEKLIAEYTNGTHSSNSNSSSNNSSEPDKKPTRGGGRGRASHGDTPEITTEKKAPRRTSSSGGGKDRRRRPSPAEAAAPEPDNAARDETSPGTPEDFSFVSDDTYALSLGKHGVCFGQGLARYINHRYNISRFGNVELCSVMLSVPSEFSPTALGRKAKAAPVKRRPAVRPPPREAGATEKPAPLPSRSKKAPRHATKVTTTTTTATSSARARTTSPSSAPRPRGGGRQDKSRRAAAVAAVSAIQDFESDLNAAYSASSSSEDDSTDSEVSSSEGGVPQGPTSAAVKKEEGTASTSFADMDDAAATALLVAHRKQVKKKRRPQATRMVFLEEQSHFVSVPFFITTADIEVGDALLAWTYGEAYDAKLERQVVAHGSLVPYADAVLLNRRVTELLARQQAYARDSLKRGRVLSARHNHLLWQRYNGDYRYALGVGDVVWRRRPVEQVVLYRALPKQGPIPCLPQRVCERRCPSPEEDLFVIVQQMRSSVEKVLLKPLRRRGLPVASLRQLLIEQDLAAYRSHAAPASWRDRSALAEAATDATALPPRLQLGAKMRHSRSVSHGRASPSQPRPPAPAASPTAHGRGGADASGAVVACAERLAEAWGVFDVSLQCSVADMRQCVVASTDSLALLLADVDYYIVQESATLRALTDTHSGGGGGGGGAAASSSPSSSSSAAAVATAASSPSAAAAAVAKAQHLIVNLDDLRDATELVRHSDRALQVPALFNGLMWPLFHRQTSNFGFECLYAADKKGPSTVKLEE